MSDTALPVLRNFLVQRYDDLKRRLARHLGSTDAANDALQDTWLRLESREAIGAVQNPGAYLMRMAVNIAVDHQRSHSTKLSATELDELLEIPDAAPGPAETAESRRELDALVAVMQQMPLRRQQILMMVRWEGLPQREVAERLGVSLRTIEQELKKAHDFCAVRTGRPLRPVQSRKSAADVHE
jgi:RNA polymerase sigma factor (sigma-70 family)